jgi:cytochrome P450
MRLVWDESLRQASEMLAWWKTQEGKGVRSTARNMSTLTLHVLASACFGKSYPFQGSTDTLTEADPTNHRDALSLVLENILLVLIFGPNFLARLSRPKRLARLGQATVTFKKYMTDLLEEEMDLMAQGKSERGNLMASLIRGSDEARETTDPIGTTKLGSRAPQSRGGDGLTEDEIYGNMFVFSFAGHDTTAHTLTFTICLLAAHPAVQEWLREELRYYLPPGPRHNWSYQETFPKLKRCLAVLVSILHAPRPPPSLD